MKFIAFVLFASAVAAQTTYNVQTCSPGQMCTYGQVTVTPQVRLDPSICSQPIVNVADKAAKIRQAELQAQLVQQQIEMNRLRLQDMAQNAPRNGWHREGKCEYLFRR